MKSSLVSVSTANFTTSDMAVTSDGKEDTGISRKMSPVSGSTKKEGDIFNKVSNVEILTKHDHHHKAIHSLGRDDDWVLADWLEDTTARECPSSNKSWLLALPEQDGSQALDREYSIISH